MAKQFESENLPEEYQARADRMNIDLDAIPAYELPPLPISDSTTPAEFLNRIRPSLVQAMADTMYGPVPPRCQELSFRLVSEAPAFDGLGIRREIDIVCRNNGKELVLHLLLYIPAKREGKVPVFFGLNFPGNHGVSNDPGVAFHPFTPYPDLWSIRFKDSRTPEARRGQGSSRFCFEKVLQAGFASATIGYYDAFRDRFDQFEGSVMELFTTRDEWFSPKRQSGAISAWAWAISRAIDCLEAQPEIDTSKICVHGHSRLGKTALWAGANDTRIAMTISNCSGTCGAKLAHRYYGENYEWIDTWNEHWCRPEFKQWIGKDTECPVDQHFLMAAIAPRLLYVASASNDMYADPRGEFQAAVEASPAWRLFGQQGLGDASFPQTGQLVGQEIGYYLREGEHNFTPENWDALIAFAKRHFDE